ncbi:MAG TPA: 4Fe-4S dicluster domain-containing protein [Bacteroidota bacterium]|nr:4Fe-4S dicluster domain-containing protein [Bacteroidota bacterium]
MSNDGTQAAPVKAKKRPRELAVVNQAGCTGCEVCIEFCPVDCILTVPGPEYDQHKKLVEIDLDVCIGCKLCVKYCPWETIEMIPSAEALGVAAAWTLRSVLPDAEWIRNSSAEIVERGPLPLPGSKIEVS